MLNNSPNFICVGAQKSGTTTLHNILTQHPDIYLPSNKETHFFDKDEKYKKGKDWWLDNYYKNYNYEQMIGDITPEYLFYDKVPERIFKMFGSDIKIIFILRDPIDRAYSHYLMSLSRGFEELSFEKAIQIEQHRINKDDFHFNHFSYLSRGFYFTQISRYLRLFDQEKMLFLSFEDDLVNDIDNTLIKVVDFLGIEKYAFNSKLKSNTANRSRYNFLNKILNANVYIKELVRFIFPVKSIRENIIIFLRGINKKDNSNYGKLDFSLRKKLLSSDLLKDIERLNNLTKGKFKYFEER